MANPVTATPLPVTADEGASALELTASEHGVVLSWLEPAAASDADPPVLALRASLLGEQGWESPITVTESDAFFANWADRPSVVAAADGLYAHWLRKLGEGTYAYGIELGRSTDSGRTWTPLGLLHDDASPSEHGFVTLLPVEEGGVQAIYLDGRATLAGEPMQLRSSAVDAEGAETSEMLDSAVCDCCATDAVALPGGWGVVYRDRTADEIRDIAYLRRSAAGWSTPARVAEDGWRIPGCPVNGPALAADGERLAVAWFTAADDRPRVLIAFSDDGGATFGAPREVDGARPLGRLDLIAADDGSAVVSWLATGPDGATVRLRRFDPQGAAGPSHDLGNTGADRAAGVPRMVRAGERVIVAWLDAAGLRTAALPLASL